MYRFILNTINALVSLVVALSLLTSGAYAGYALWDNEQVYSAAEDVQAELAQFKPKAVEEEAGPTFDELLAINPDVCGWVTLDNTGIDYPILQGETNLTYINTDVYGNPALAGSIFLDSRNDRAFGDVYSLLYGHHMDKHKMFGDLDLYKDKKFFEKNTTGTLITPDATYNLEIFACLLVPANEDNIFEVTRWRTDITGLLDYTRENAMYIHEETMNALEPDSKVLSLSTCATEFTDARTIVLAAMKPYA